MFGIGFGELVLIGFVALIIFGPDKLPEVASKFGKFMGTFRKTSDKFRQEFYNSVYTPTRDLGKNIQNNLIAVKEEVKQEVTIKPEELLGEKIGEESANIKEQAKNE